MAVFGAQRLIPSWVLACCVGLAACGSPLGQFGTGTHAPSPFRDPNLSLQAAFESVTTEKTTQSEVLGALGPATEITFDSGFSVWVYRAPSPESQSDRAELVILFAPSGVVQKKRLRPALNRSEHR